jgi:hypothetical protein
MIAQKRIFKFMAILCPLKKVKIDNLSFEEIIILMSLKLLSSNIDKKLVFSN